MATENANLSQELELSQALSEAMGQGAVDAEDFAPATAVGSGNKAKTMYEQTMELVDEDNPAGFMENAQELSDDGQAAEEPKAAEGEASSEGQEDDSMYPEIELKVKGYKEPQKIKLNPNDPKLLERINKGIRFDKKMAEVSKQTKDLEAKIHTLNELQDKAVVADKVAEAQQLLSEGYAEQALSAVLGDSSEDFINELVEQRLAYQNASPEERIKMEISKREKAETLARKRAADKIAKLEAQLNSRSDSNQEAEFSGYLEDAKDRYDLSQWVDDSDTAGYLNQVLYNTAMSDVIKLQRQREAQGKDSVSQKDIRRAFATHANKLIKSQRSQASKIADSKIAEQSEAATKNAQVASTKKYQGGNEDLDKLLKSSKGSMSALTKLLGGRGSI